MLPLTTYAEKSPSHIVMIIVPLDASATKEEEEKLISRHSVISGANVTSNNPKKRETIEFLESFDAELTRQSLAFQNHYAHPMQNATPMGLTSLDLQTLGSMTASTNPPSLGFNTFPAGAPLQKSFIQQSSGGYPAQTGEPQFSPFFSNIPSNLQSLPAMHYAPDNDSSSSHIGRGSGYQPVPNNPYLVAPAMNQLKAGSHMGSFPEAFAPNANTSNSKPNAASQDRSGAIKTSSAVYSQDQHRYASSSLPASQLAARTMIPDAYAPTADARHGVMPANFDDSNINEASTLLHLRNPLLRQGPNDTSPVIKEEESRPRKSSDGNTFASV